MTCKGGDVGVCAYSVGACSSCSEADAAVTAAEIDDCMTGANAQMLQGGYWGFEVGLLGV